MVSTEGNTLTGLTNLLASPIHPDRTVHRLFCIAMLALASATAVSAQDTTKRRDVPRSVKAPKAQPPDTRASKVENQPPPEGPVPPGAPATLRLQFPNSDVVDVL